MIIEIRTDWSAFDTAGRQVVDFSRFGPVEARRKMEILINDAHLLGWLIIDNRLRIDQEPDLPGEIPWYQK